jgi:thymidylate synthase
MNSYLNIVKTVLTNGIVKEDRTGTGTKAIAGAMFECDLSDGYPLLTTKNMPFRLIASELEFFIKGQTNKEWLLDRENHIWDEWCSPDKVPYSHDAAEQERMLKEKELGPIYGWQWRNFGAHYVAHNQPKEGAGKDQLKEVVQMLREDPTSRRMLVLAWNPQDLHRMALPPCHYGFQVTVLDGRLNLLWNQRSVDVALGLPFNIASYALLLHLLAKEAGLEEGKLVGFLADTHVYLNHIKGLEKQLERKPMPLSRIKTENFASIFDWEYQQTKVIDYEHHPGIAFDIAV